jgi:AraC family transcriptional regulator, transcriptional activator of pobA
MLQQKASVLHGLRQNERLPIRMVSRQFGHLSPEEAAVYQAPPHLPYYLFVFMLDGNSWHKIDLRPYEAGKDELLFVMPHQMHGSMVTGQGADLIKLGLDDTCLCLLPQQYPFLIDPLGSQKVCFTSQAAIRVRAVLAMLLNLLSNRNTEPSLILAHLNTLLTEANTAYFAGQRSLPDQELSKFVRFKAYVEEHLTEQPRIAKIAADIGMNTNALYQLTMRYAGMSPKAYLTQRSMLEARRRIHLAQSFTVKELAFSLGFNDPDHFSRTFKKFTGQTIAQFAQETSGH